MEGGTAAFVDGMGAIGIFHEIDGLIEFDQAIQQKLGAGIVDVVVAGTMDQKQTSSQGVCEING